MLYRRPSFAFFLLPAEQGTCRQWDSSLPIQGQAAVPEGDHEAWSRRSWAFLLHKYLEGTERSRVLGAGDWEQATGPALVIASYSMRETPISLKYSLSFFFLVSVPSSVLPFTTAGLMAGLKC